MIIDASNARIINSKEINIHDSILEEFCFNRDENKLHLVLISENEVNNQSSYIDF